MVRAAQGPTASIGIYVNSGSIYEAQPEESGGCAFMMEV